MTANVAIVDCGGANIASLMVALERLGARGRLTAQASEITSASRVILPGVGSAADAMRKLRKEGLADCIRALTQPVLGICLGLQLLADSSEEDDVDCLGILPGAARKLQGSPQTPVPNMGWCRVRQVDAHPLLDGIADDSWFYFLHSYALPVNGCSLATAVHREPLTAVAGHRNFLATQFHPERSSAAGARLLQNFLAL
jgi:imidazole glycerol-phosphate synthase subunit HisH